MSSRVYGPRSSHAATNRCAVSPTQAALFPNQAATLQTNLPKFTSWPQEQTFVENFEGFLLEHPVVLKYRDDDKMSCRIFHGQCKSAMPSYGKYVMWIRGSIHLGASSVPSETH
ncbi:hypothetical protein TWF730_002730 [Orbilia blumenaviensis]|uniref:Uncharacterized protein n=1 Tax=Orbilia blumenaviensis TaxID=1796055 RepID=A0AAV9U703_9PEZI